MCVTPGSRVSPRAAWSSATDRAPSKSRSGRGKDGKLASGGTPARTTGTSPYPSPHLDDDRQQVPPVPRGRVQFQGVVHAEDDDHDVRLPDSRNQLVEDHPRRRAGDAQRVPLHFPVRVRAGEPQRELPGERVHVGECADAVHRRLADDGEPQRSPGAESALDRPRGPGKPRSRPTHPDCLRDEHGCHEEEEEQPKNCHASDSNEGLRQIRGIEGSCPQGM